MNFSSKLIEDAVNEFSKLPGVGKKTALRLVLHLLKKDKEAVNQFSSALVRMREEIQYCRQCHNISDDELCEICQNNSRESTFVCVVESIRDVIAIENTHQFNGMYHVLGGIINPVEGIGPENINIDSLVERTQTVGVKEVIMALSPTIEGDTTVFYISKKLQPLGVKVTTISRGVAFGGDLEYTDDLTLARSIANRQPYENYLINR